MWPAIALINEDPVRGHTGQIGGLRENVAKRVPVIGVAMQGIGMKHKHAAGGAPVGGRDRGLAAELVRGLGLGFAFANALHLSGMPGIDFGRGLAVQGLTMNDPRLREGLGKLRFTPPVFFDQTLNVADHPSKSSF